MAGLNLQTETLDDAMRQVVKLILSSGESIRPRKGPAKELFGVLIEITNPLARISRTETRGKPFSCLGELCWYLASSNDLDFIEYYISAYGGTDEQGKIFGGYGPRLFNWRGMDQFNQVADLIRRNPDTRRAVIQIFDAHDLLGDHKDIPCTCTLQFMLRENKLNLFTYMRSNDAYLGMPHDVFCFTMLQEIMARKLSAEIGTYKHAVGSLHLYDKNLKSARRFLMEGWQPTTEPMPAMPIGDPTEQIRNLVKLERSIRLGKDINDSSLHKTDPYWADLIRLLLLFRHKQDKDVGEMKKMRSEMSSGIYTPYINRLIDQTRRQVESFQCS